MPCPCPGVARRAARARAARSAGVTGGGARDFVAPMNHPVFLTDMRVPLLRRNIRRPQRIGAGGAQGGARVARGGKARRRRHEAVRQRAKEACHRPIILRTATASWYPAGRGGAADALFSRSLNHPAVLSRRSQEGARRAARRSEREYRSVRAERGPCRSGQPAGWRRPLCGKSWRLPALRGAPERFLALVRLLLGRKRGECCRSPDARRQEFNQSVLRRDLTNI